MVAVWHACPYQGLKASVAWGADKGQGFPSS